MKFRLQAVLILALIIILGCSAKDKSADISQTTTDVPASQITISKLENGTDEILYLGKVDDVIEGRITEVSQKQIPAANFKAAYEAGSTGDIKSLGEFIAVNGVAYGRSTDLDSIDYFSTTNSDGFVTTCAAFIPKEARPSYSAESNPAIKEAIVVSDLYEELQQSVKSPFCFTGLMEFEKLDAVAVGKAPIFNENLFEHKSDYYPKSIESKASVQAFAMGCVADFGSNFEAGMKANLERILYNNPFDKSKMSAHTHVLTLKTKVNNISKVTPEVADQVSHLLSQSTLTGFDLEIYPIGSLVEYNNY